MPNTSGEQLTFLCRVLVGEYCKGKQDALTPDMCAGYDLYDSTVDRASNPGILVTYHDAQAHPEYLIRFIKRGSLPGSLDCDRKTRRRRRRRNDGLSSFSLHYRLGMEPCCSRFSSSSSTPSPIRKVYSSLSKLQHQPPACPPSPLLAFFSCRTTNEPMNVVLPK